MMALREIGVILLGCVVSGAAAQPAEFSEADFAKAWEDAREPVLPTKPFYAEYEVEYHAGVHPDVLRRMAERIGDSPNDPGRMFLEQARQRSADGPDVTRKRIWFFEPGVWRESNDPAGSQQYVADFVVNGQIRWTAAPQQAAVSDARTGIPNGRDTATSSPISGVIRHLGMFYHGAIAEHRLEAGQPSGVDLLPAGSWVGTSESEDGAESVKVMIEKVSGGHRFSEAQRLIKGDRQRVGQWGPDVRVTASGWTRNEFLGREVATLVEVGTGDGVLYERYRLIEWGPLPADVDRRALLRVPDFKAADPIRGAFAFPELVDYRESLHDPSILRWNAEAQEPDEFRVPNPLVPRGFSLKKWSRSIVVGVAVLVILVAIVVKRRG